MSTNIFTSAINRLSEYLVDVNEIWENIEEEKMEQFRNFIEESPALTPEEVADITFQAIRDEKLHIFTHTQPILRDAVKERLDAILKAFD